jgi:hypothetical protein
MNRWHNAIRIEGSIASFSMEDIRAVPVNTPNMQPVQENHMRNR